MIGLKWNKKSKAQIGLEIDDFAGESTPAGSTRPGVTDWLDSGNVQVESKILMYLSVMHLHRRDRSSGTQRGLVGGLEQSWWKALLCLKDMTILVLKTLLSIYFTFKKF